MQLEKEIQLAICRYLKLKGHFFHRMNNVGVFDKERNAFRFNHYGIKGVPDIYVYVKGKIIALEVKRPDTQQSPEQKLFEQVFKQAGGEYYVVRSLDDVMKIGL